MSNATRDTTGATSISGVTIPNGKLDRETTEPLAGSVHDVTAQKSFVSIAAHAGERPSWLVDSLGSAGVPSSRVEDFVPPPESSDGVLFLELQLKLLPVYARRIRAVHGALACNSWPGNVRSCKTS
jgi:hypothetical protein